MVIKLGKNIQVFYYVYMHDSRKNILSILFSSLLTLFNLVVIICLVLLVIYGNILYVVPLGIYLLSALFNFVLDFKNYRTYNSIDSKVHLMVDGQEVEKSHSKIKIGDEINLYPSERVDYVCQVKSGILYVDESNINGTSEIIKKEVGSFIKPQSIVTDGNGVVEITNLCRNFIKSNNGTQTTIFKRIRLFNFIFTVFTAAIITLGFALENNGQTGTIGSTAALAVMSLPCLFNLLATIYLFACSINLKKENIEIKDRYALTEIENIDVICFDKTGTLTNGQFEIIKTLPILHSAFASVSLDTNQAFVQLVSNVINSTKEKGGYYETLRRQFDYEPNKIIDDISPIGQNGLYSAVTVRGGKSYAIGEVNNFDLANKDNLTSSVNDYSSFGYHILLLVESKKPLKNGLIDGKSTAIGLIILEEQMDNSAKEAIADSIKEGKKIVIISGDKPYHVIEIARRCGLENVNQCVDLSSVSDDLLVATVKDNFVFANASNSQKQIIIKTLKELGHKVMFVGDGDNDAAALKESNLAIALSRGTNNAKMCSQVVVDRVGLINESLISKGARQREKLYRIMSMIFAQSIFVSLISLIFMSISLSNNQITNPFNYQSLLMWNIFGVYIPSIIILVDKTNKSFKTSFIRSQVLDSLVYLIPIGIIYSLQLLQFVGLGYFCLPSDYNELHELIITSQVTNNLCYIMLMVLSLFIVYRHLSPTNTFRMIAFISIIFLPVIYIVLIVFNNDGVSVVTQINTSILTTANYGIAGVITFISGSLYLLINHIIGVIKGENINVKD